MSQLIEGIGYKAKVVRSRRRKTVALEVKRGEVTVRAPYYVSDGDIQQFVRRRERWLRNILDKHRALPPKPILDFSENAEWYFLGEKYNLNFIQKSSIKKAQVEILGDSLRICQKSKEFEKEKLSRLLADFYKTQAMEYLTQRVQYFKSLLNVNPRQIKVRRYKSRWGSCNSRGELSFNWLIMMAPREVVDYVVVHELSHLKHFDHSPKFWQCVASVMPNYQQHKHWLNQQNQLHWDEE